MTAHFGTFADHNSRASYENNANCVWKITPEPKVDSVTLSFDHLDLELGYDFIYIFDGDNATTAHLIGAFTGSAIPPAVVATSGTMIVLFQTDIFLTKQGFRASYTTSVCLNSCSGSGHCYQGVCQCHPGYGGEDCSQSMHAFNGFV